MIEGGFSFGQYIRNISTKLSGRRWEPVRLLVVAWRGHSKTLKEFQRPGLVPLVQAPKLLRFLRSGVLVSLDGVFHAACAAVVQKGLVVSQTRPESPESGRPYRSSGLPWHPFTQNARSGSMSCNRKSL
jgi:hypothetical protein